MKFRLVCIIKKDSLDKGVDIEVCLETGSKTLSPFQRKVTIDDLLKSEEFASDTLCQLLFQTGQNRQPFVFSPEQVSCKILRQAINSHPWLYVKSGGKGSSLKRVASLSGYLPFGKRLNFQEGSLMGGELYISNIKVWWKNLKVRLRYEGATSLFPAQYVDIPFETDDNRWMLRCEKKECELLSLLGSSLDYERSILHIKEDNFDMLKSLMCRGWKLLVPQGTDSHVPVYLKSNKSGIEWFSTGSAGSDDDGVAEKILEAYLFSRNYAECDGNINLFSRQKITSLPPEVVTGTLVKDLDAEKLYLPLPVLTNDELNKIHTVVLQKINAKLKPYQMEGVIWLAKMRKKGTGCLLADDMGLGKTLQVLVHLAILEDGEKKHLVICPASLTANWENEINKFAPQLSSMIEIASYEAVRIHTEKFSCNKYDTIIVDEGQLIKNDNTQRHKAIGELMCDHMIILSGTPIENSVDEIWSQFKLLIPEMEIVFNKIKTFNVQGDDKRWVELSKLFLSPFILRRTKDEVLKNLPRKFEKNIFIELSEEELSVYKAIRTIFIKAIETGISGRINSIALEGLLRLRQCCVSLNLLPKSLTHKGYVKSTKIELAVKMIKDFIADGHQILVFSQFTSALDELEERLTQDSVKLLLLTGNTRNRQVLVDSFQNDDKNKVFLISLKAGGTGLNLTAADRVILLDDWWNPAVENQAFARAHRIGQHNTVEVYRLVCRNTVEEKILELHKNKKEMSDLFNAVGDKLSVEQIRKLLN